MWGMPRRGACKAAVVIRSYRFAAPLSLLRAASWPACPRAARRGALSMIAVAIVALPAQLAVLAGSAAGPDWTKQAPATSPPARSFASMAYDAATGDIVLFGGDSSQGIFGDTWTWDGSTWTKQAPTAHPSARSRAAMAYDAATHDIVLFGGTNLRATFGDTWTWGGSG
jgi:hypothetical protein